VTSASVEERLLALEARQAVVERLHRYAHAIDYGDEAAWLDCFVEGAVFDVRMRLGTRPDVRCEGRAQLAAFIAAHTRPPVAYHKHLLADPVVVLEDDWGRATCHSYFVRVDAGEPRVARVVAMGRYVDRLVRDDDGAWRFQERSAELENQ
jgi:3-phenylpropionate/cinnamic acid dioxygenase small subunit